MLGPSAIVDGTVVHRVLTAAVFLIGVGLLASGVANFTGLVDWQLPPLANFAVAVVLFAYAALLLRRS